MLEASLKPENSFVTLTYEKDPVSLEPLHLKAFLDRLRKLSLPTRFRFYAVGEYGEKNGRPHYHLVLFGLPPCRSLRSRRNGCCAPCDTLRRAWGRGFVDNLPFTIKRARYIAKYTLKKMTRFDDARLKPHQHPEFARMSLKNGGIGYGALDYVCNTIRKFNLLTPEGDVPVTLRHGNTEMPLGRYLRQQARKKLGLDHRAPHVLSAEAAYAHSLTEEGQAMLALQKAAIANKTTLREEILSASATKRAQITARSKLFHSKGQL